MSGVDDESHRTPQMYTDHIDAMLDNALDMDITEFDFWNMTIGEFNRIYNSKMRVKKVRDQEVAIHNYILGDLIGRSMARLQSSSVTYPQIYEAYPSLFDKDEFERRQKERITEESIQRLKQFAESFKKRNDKGGQIES
jgi:hypothetical protein